MVVYNLIWGIAWFAFMRDEWLDAMTAIGQPMPWTAEIWFVWVTLTMPLGTAVMAYTASHRHQELVHCLRASAMVWAVFAVGMTVWCIQASLSIRIIALDAGINLFGMISAAIIGGWSIRSE